MKLEGPVVGEAENGQHDVATQTWVGFCLCLFTFLSMSSAAGSLGWYMIFCTCRGVGGLGHTHGVGGMTMNLRLDFQPQTPLRKGLGYSEGESLFNLPGALSSFANQGPRRRGLFVRCDPSLPGRLRAW